MKVPFLDLRVVDADERRDLLSAFETVLDHGRILLGPEVDELEARIACRIGSRYAVGCNSGTDALIIAMRALDIGPGDEVVVPALSFIATANAVSLVGATPVFADLEDDLTISVDSVEALLSERTKAVIPVHWAGKMCDIRRLCELAGNRGIAVVEDASQAFDASVDGRKAGSHGVIGCYSMNSMKVFASLGEAGMLVTNDALLRERMVALRYHGLVNRESCTRLAQNSRLDTLQAAALLVRLSRLDDVIDRRRANAGYFNRRLGEFVSVPHEGPGHRDVYYTYTIQTDFRDELRKYLADHEIQTAIQHTLLMPEHPIYVGRVRGQWSRARALMKRVLCLPCSEKLTSAEAAYVAESVLEFIGNGWHTSCSDIDRAAPPRVNN